VADDDTLAARLMKRLLEQDGHTVRTAACVSDALRLASAEPFELLIADYQLPDGNGCDVLRQVRLTRECRCAATPPQAPQGPQETRATPVMGIIVTGFADEDHARDSTDAGFAAYLVKPIMFADLARAIARLRATAGA